MKRECSSRPPQKERADKVAEMAAKRAKIQQQIKKLNAEREVFLAAERKKQGEDTGGTLGAEVRKAVRQQAASLGYDLSFR